jgi:hypothetical protein
MLDGMADDNAAERHPTSGAAEWMGVPRVSE